MKSVLSLSVFVAAAIAAKAAIPANAQWYTLQTKASVNTLSNLFLAAKDGKVGGFSGTRESAQVAGKFFTTSYSGAGTLSLHAGDDTHQLGLSGTNGLLKLVDLVNPSADTIPKDTPTEWSVFQIGQGGEVTVKDGQDVPTRKWVTYLETDGAYYVGLWDGVTPQPRTVANITLVATKSTAPAGPKMVKRFF
ncbi:hypothetical protein EJ08DRAFT_646639 [Tothia fuscella]|uniref:Uncharacterized protein n=1 Tax=Tothia fuscella TaxID=1048955 RepID=A0A9P4U252_9PEZI|nr:hypothetical protein EJ08DRAFT_646639 [Tothia fuscella]